MNRPSFAVTWLLRAALVSSLFVAGPLAAQVTLGLDPGGAVRTRGELERLVSQYEQALSSPVYSESVKSDIRVEVERLRSRLQQGDFRTGDRIFLSVQGEPNLPDTVTVEPGPKVVLPLFGDIPLAGILRSELTQHLTQELSRFIRDPVVRANGLMRLAVIGSVARPGFYAMPAEMLVGEALMFAGGPTASSNLDGMRIERGQQVLLQGQALQEAMREGLTLDQLNLQAGDQIMVPERRAGGTLATLGLIAGLIGSISILIFR